ncbi:LacI family DNA-binding transcriptional regulator [Agromyces seonyuensis]|uniref:Substrate-binding domain-containing protein n=1 Tax=Agromyces seonyuensis TaxID=2662446 RepID=A0A6I4NXX6_9MICO|nr:LacI family DNA-binding transcriptional regulator [Agromyces seonyuensis]MWB99166.1 substrate-binding domain-containing protein [Agromyces seonyuensis]
MDELAPMRRKPTIRDVASVAGVSRTTVSRVVNGGRWVSPDARRAVETAIAATGFTANHHARSLATGRADSVAFLLTEPQHLLFSDPNFALLLRGAAAALAARGKTLVLLVAGTAAERTRVQEYVSAGHVDGVLLVSPHESDPLPASLRRAGVSTVSCGQLLGLPGEVPTVSIDEAASARAMTRHLLGQGHRRIAMIAGPVDTPGGRYRLEGFREALGNAFDPLLVEAGDYSFASGASAMTRLLGRDAGIDAVFAASDLMAAGALSALRQAGIRVPEDLAVAGFDDSGIAAAQEPPLTTMRQPWDRISETMVGMLLDVVDGVPRRPVILPTELVVRASA